MKDLMNLKISHESQQSDINVKARDLKDSRA